MTTCPRCGGAKFDPGEIAGWAGKVCYCKPGITQNPNWLPLTEEDVRRIVREEIKRLLDERSPL